MATTAPREQEQQPPEQQPSDTGPTFPDAPGAEVRTPPSPPALAQRLKETWKVPKSMPGMLMEVQNDPIAARFFVLIFLLFSLAGLMALLMRTQLALPENTFLDPQTYNQFFTMHGTTMMFLVAVPVMGTFATLLLPQILGTRDMPFPRMTGFGWWAFLGSSLFFYVSFLFGTVPDGGWFAYTPLTGKTYSPGLGLDFWLLGLGLAEIGSLGAATELLVAVLKTRAPGMSFSRIPVFAWTFLAMGFAIIFGFTPVLVATTLLELDRKVGTRFFDPAGGGDPLLWQHLFWIFGHPEVYIMFLPGTGMVSTMLPALARRPLAGHTLIVLAIVATTFLSFGLWVHHMFATGLPVLGLSFFSAASLTITIPSGIQVFAWIATLWAGRPKINTPLLFIIGFIIIFLIGGLSGPMVASVPFNWQVHDTFFVVAHFHYVLFGGVIFPMFAAFYYWLPKLSGRLFNERLGKWNFWLIFVGFNVTFFPMHLTGLLGMPRRVYTYPPGLGWEWLNLTSTIGSYVLGVGVLLFVVNFVYSFGLGKGAPITQNPWGAGTLEWATPTPLEALPYFALPIIRGLYPLWQQERLDRGTPLEERVARGFARAPIDWRGTLVTSVLDARPQAVMRVPGLSWWPLALTASLTPVFAGIMVDQYLVAILGGLATLVVLAAWFWPDSGERAWARSGEQVLVHGLPVLTSGTSATGWWAMASVIMILSVALAMLAFSYLYLRAGAAAWPPPGMARPDLLPPSLATVPLLASLLPLWWAERGIRRGERGRLLLGLTLGFALGGLFLALQLWGFTITPFTPQASVYGSLFFTIAGFYAVLTLAGLLIYLEVQVHAWRGYFNRWRFLAVQNTVFYWTFLAVAWLVVYGLVYVSPYVL